MFFRILGDDGFMYSESLQIVLDDLPPETEEDEKDAKFLTITDADLDKIAKTLETKKG